MIEPLWLECLAAGDVSATPILHEDPNPSGLEPLGRAVLVAPFEPERQRSMIALPSHVLANERILDVKVRVIAVGPECWPDEAARCAPGDVVFVAKMSGFVTQGPR